MSNNRELRYQGYIGLMIAFLIPLILWVLAGCTVYTVERTEESTKVRVLSTRDFEQPELHYKREGENAEFDFGAAKAETNSPLEAIGAAVVQKMLNIEADE